MKKSLLFLLVLLGISLSSCNSYRPFIWNKRYPDPVQTQVILDQPNFRVVKNVEVVMPRKIKKSLMDNPSQSIYSKLLEEANLTGNQTLINVFIDCTRHNYFGPKYWRAYATVIEFVDTNSAQDYVAQRAELKKQQEQIERADIENQRASVQSLLTKRLSKNSAVQNAYNVVKEYLLSQNRSNDLMEIEKYIVSEGYDRNEKALAYEIVKKKDALGMLDTFRKYMKIR